MAKSVKKNTAAFSKLLQDSIFNQLQLESEVTRYKDLYNKLKIHTGTREAVIKDIKTHLIELGNFKEKFTSSPLTSDNDYKLFDKASLDVFVFLYQTFHENSISQDYNKVIHETRDKMNVDLPKDINPLFKLAVQVSGILLESERIKHETRINTVVYRWNYLKNILDCLSLYGLHSNIQKRNNNLYSCLVEVHNVDTGNLELKYKMALTSAQLQSLGIINSSNINEVISWEGEFIRLKNIKKYIIIEQPYQLDEIYLLFEKHGLSLKSNRDVLYFFKLFPNISDSILHKRLIDEPLKEELLNATESLKNLLITRHIKKKEERNREYSRLRSLLKKSKDTWNLTPDFITENHSFDEFWAKCKNWISKEEHISEKFQPLFDYLENYKSQSLLDVSLKEAIKTLDYESLIASWELCLKYIDSSPEDAIVRSRSLVESVCKEILRREGDLNVNKNEDLPQLFRKVLETLKKSSHMPTQGFERVLSGLHQIVHGISNIRNKHSSAHGKSKSEAENLVLKRHAHLVVNSSAVLTEYLITEWKEIQKVTRRNLQ